MKHSLYGSTHTDGSKTTACPQNSSYVVDNKYISLVLYRVAINNSHELQNAVCISACCRLTPVSPPSPKKTLSSSRCQLTQDENATLPLQHCHNDASSWISFLNLFRSLPLTVYLDALVECRLPPTWACIQLQFAVDFGDTKLQYERLINCKIDAHMLSVWVEPISTYCGVCHIAIAVKLWQLIHLEIIFEIH